MNANLQPVEAAPREADPIADPIQVIGVAGQRPGAVHRLNMAEKDRLVTPDALQNLFPLQGQLQQERLAWRQLCQRHAVELLRSSSMA